MSYKRRMWESANIVYVFWNLLYFYEYHWEFEKSRTSVEKYIPSKRHCWISMLTFSVQPIRKQFDLAAKTRLCCHWSETICDCPEECFCETRQKDMKMPQHVWVAELRREVSVTNITPDTSIHSEDSVLSKTTTDILRARREKTGWGPKVRNKAHHR